MAIVAVLGVAAVGAVTGVTLALTKPEDVPVPTEPGAETVDPPPEPVRSSRAAAVPNARSAESRREIRRVIERFHVALIEDRLVDAWNLLTPRKRRQYRDESAAPTAAGLPPLWVTRHRELAVALSVPALTVEVQQVQDRGRVARVLVRGMRKDNCPTGVAEYEGLTWVRWEAASKAWRYDPGYSTTDGREEAWGTGPRRFRLLGIPCTERPSYA